MTDPVLNQIIVSVDYYMARCDIAESVGGISNESVIDHVAVVPVGWWQDFVTGYWLPPEFSFGYSQMVH